MKLNLIERLELINRFPKEAPYTTLVVLRDLKKKINITQKEIVDFKIENFVDDAGNPSMRYHTKALDPINYKLTDLETQELKNLLEPLAESPKFPENLLDVYEQILKTK